MTFSELSSQDLESFMRTACSLVPEDNNTNSSTFIMLNKPKGQILVHQLPGKKKNRTIRKLILKKFVDNKLRLVKNGGAYYRVMEGVLWHDFKPSTYIVVFCFSCFHLDFLVLYINIVANFLRETPLCASVKFLLNCWLLDYS